MDRAPGRRRNLALVVVAVLTVAAIVGLIVFYPADWPGFAQPTPITVTGQDTEGIYRVVFTIAAIIFLLVEGLILFAVLRYRRTDEELPVQTHGNGEISSRISRFTMRTSVSSSTSRTWSRQ